MYMGCLRKTTQFEYNIVILAGTGIVCLLRGEKKTNKQKTVEFIRGINETENNVCFIHGIYKVV